jgi:hypothetical protein
MVPGTKVLMFCHFGGHMVGGSTLNHIDRLYCPPTSYNADDISPNEQLLTVLSSSSKMFPGNSSDELRRVFSHTIEPLLRSYSFWRVW